MITVNWLALLQVTAVTFSGTILLVGVVSAAAALLDRGHVAVMSGEARSPYHSHYTWLSFFFFAIALGVVGFGFYLLIPWWH